MVDMVNNLRQILGTILWWAEGTKSRKDKRWKNCWTYNVEITNTNPEMIKIFLNFLRNDFEIDENKLKLQLQIHEGDNREQLEKFWQEISDIPRSRFNKTIVRSAGNKPGKTMGTCKIRYCDKKIYQQINDNLNRLLRKLSGD